MAGPWYVRSTDGSDASDGLSWANAKATLAGAASAASAGDTIYVSHVHAETQATAMTITLPGTVASPNYVICVNDAAEPPTAVAATATVSTTGANVIDVKGHGYVYGIIFSAGSSTSSASIRLTQGDTRSNQFYENCQFILNNSSASSTISAPPGGSSKITMKNCGYKFGGTSQALNGVGKTFIDGGSLLSGGTSPTYLIADNYGAGRVLEISGLDLSNAAAGIDIFRGSTGSDQMRAVLRNIRLPGSWSGTLFSTAPTVEGSRCEMYNSDSSDTNYRIWIEDAYGALTQETTLVRTGGATDGTTPLAWKIATTTRCNTASGLFQSAEIVRWNETTGSAITATVEFLHDSTTNAKDNEIWLEVMYLGTSGVPLGTWTSDRAADILATAADQTDSSATWTTTGMTNPNTQKLSVSFTPQEKGFIHARVVVAKASWTVYVDPKIALL